VFTVLLLVRFLVSSTNADRAHMRIEQI